MDIFLMSRDTEILKFNFDEGIYEVLNEKMLPYQLKGRLNRVPDFSEIKTRYDDIQRTIIINKNYNAVIEFLSGRVLPLSRENAKKIYQLFNFEQLQDDVSKSKIALVCKAVSLLDNYWIKNIGDTLSWAQVNLRSNSLSDIVAQVSLHGSSLSLQGKVHTPELNGQGAYAKAWFREDDELYLHKLGNNGSSWESKVEVMVSNILDKCNVNHLKYEEGFSNDKMTCKCKCMTNDNLSILSGMEFISYCNANGLDSDKEIMRIDPDSIYKMWIVDYLICNGDRHGMNWGFYYDSNSMDILGCHPLYDHNNAFDIELMKNEDAKYLFDSRMTMREAAHLAMKNTDFYFTDDIIRDDFLTERQYESFMKRANELKIPTYSLDKKPYNKCR